MVLEIPREHPGFCFVSSANFVQPHNAVVVSLTNFFIVVSLEQASLRLEGPHSRAFLQSRAAGLTPSHRFIGWSSLTDLHPAQNFQGEDGFSDVSSDFSLGVFGRRRLEQRAGFFNQPFSVNQPASGTSPPPPPGAFFPSPTFSGARGGGGVVCKLRAVACRGSWRRTARLRGECRWAWRRAPSTLGPSATPPSKPWCVAGGQQPGSDPPQFSPLF